tara:strand:- start:3207 stop:3926 length:720 start_codon:yes stop_codon:yes gene_type:complete
MYHPLVQRTKSELENQDNLKNVNWEERRKFQSEYLPISVEPKLRERALAFMDTLIKKLKKNNHSIKFEYQRCHIEMYGYLTEINLRQKYFRIRIKDKSGYSCNTYEKSNKLEFQVGSYARKGWIDGKSKSIEDYLPAIYDYIDSNSKSWVELHTRQKKERERREIQKKIDEKILKQQAVEQEKFNRLITDAKNHNTANTIRSYLKDYETMAKSSEYINCEYKLDLNWAYKKADEIDPLS